LGRGRLVQAGIHQFLARVTVAHVFGTLPRAERRTVRAGTALRHTGASIADPDLTTRLAPDTAGPSSARLVQRVGTHDHHRRGTGRRPPGERTIAAGGNESRSAATPSASTSCRQPTRPDCGYRCTPPPTAPPTCSPTHAPSPTAAGSTSPPSTAATAPRSPRHAERRCSPNAAPDATVCSRRRSDTTNGGQPCK
jgi:hypothetical protein